MTQDILHQSSVGPEDRSLRAQQAVKTFRAMQHGLSGYARAITGDSRVEVVLSDGPPRTDGKKIYFRPPIALGDRTPHNRGKCDLRDPKSRVLLCPACAVREEVLIKIYHEIAHIAFGTFAKPTDAARKEAVMRAIDEAGTKYAERIKAAWDQIPPYKQDDYINLSSLISPFLPVIVNALEDSRVDTAMFKARRGTKVMFDAMSNQIFMDGVEEEDGTKQLWSERPLNAQIVVGIFAVAHGYKIDGWFHEKVEKALYDKRLNELIDRMQTARSAEASYNLAFPILARLRELGFCLKPEEEEEPDESDSNEEEDEPEAVDPSDEDDAEAGEDSSEPGSEGDADSGDSEQDQPADSSPSGDPSSEAESDPSSESESGLDSSEDSVPDDSSHGDVPDDGAEEGEPRRDPEGQADGRSPEVGETEDGDDRTDEGSDEELTDEQTDSDGAGDEDSEGDSGGSDSEESGDQSDGVGDSSGDRDGESEDSEGDDGSADSRDSGDASEGEEDAADVDPVDTGADEGEGGVEVDDPEYGTAEDALGDVQAFGQHEEVVATPTPSEQADEKAIDIAVIQGLYFEKPSANVRGVREHKFGQPLYESGHDMSTGWQNIYGDYSSRTLKRHGIDADTEVPETILGPALLEMRRVFSDNQRAAFQRHLKSGRINQRVLGKRGWNNDERLFQKKRIPGKKSYAVVIGIDISGSTLGLNIALAKRAARAQAELCHRMGIDFAIYAHTANGSWTDPEALYLDVYEIKAFAQPWANEAQTALDKISADSENLDGHGVEYYRKLVERHPATDKIILYYSDGKMPAANYVEELEILQREIAYCKTHKITLMGVGIRTDSPQRHGLETVQVNDDSDIAKVVRHLQSGLLHNR